MTKTYTAESLKALSEKIAQESVCGLCFPEINAKIILIGSWYIEVGVAGTFLRVRHVCAKGHIAVASIELKPKIRLKKKFTLSGFGGGIINDVN